MNLSLSIALLVSAQLLAAPLPESDPLPTPITLEIHGAQPFPAARLAHTVRSLQLGPQSGIVKVLKGNGEVLWTRGFDDLKVARLPAEEHAKIFTALKVEEAQLDSLAQALMKNSGRLPASQTTALVGAIAIHPATNAAGRQVIEKWLIGRLKSDPKDVVTRRQAILALALLPQVSEESLTAVLQIYEKSHNLWETFPVGQFVEYHASDLGNRPDTAQIRARLQSVQSIYTPGMLENLAQSQAPEPTKVDAH